MLYVTTRNDFETYTAYHALNDSRGSDGGFYVPLRLPEISVDSLKGKSPNQTVAEILNLLFSVQLSGRDVDLAIGKAPVRLTSMNHRITVAESWHNLDWDFYRMVKNVTAQIRGTRDTEREYGVWANLAVRIGVLFGTFGELMRQEILGKTSAIDVAVPSTDFSAVMSAWYARAMGLPIGNIVICCNENNNLWELINHGEMRTGRIAVTTSTPACDKSVPELLEQLIYACGGAAETERYVSCFREGKTYYPDPEVLEKMREGLHVTVVGQRRLESTIPGAYATHGYVFGPYSALTYAGLLDYRARTGGSRSALILSEKGVLLDDGFVAGAMGITVEQLNKLLE